MAEPKVEEQAENKRYLRPDVKPECMVIIFEDGFAVKVGRDEAHVATPFGNRYILREGGITAFGIEPDLIVDKETYSRAYEELVKAWKMHITGIESLTEKSVKLALSTIGIAVNSRVLAIIPSQY